MTLEGAVSAEKERSIGKAPVATAALTRSPMMKGTKPLASPCAKRHVGEGDHPRQAQDVHREERHKRGRCHREDTAVGAALRGQTRDCGDQEVAEDVAEGGEGPADVSYR